MMQMGVKVTPTFRLYKNAALTEVVTGTNERQIQHAIDKNYGGVCVLASLDSIDDDDEENGEAKQNQSPSSGQ